MRSQILPFPPEHTIRDLHPSERPRERCLENGAQTLSLRECLALILNSGPPGLGSLGLSSQILSRPGRGLGEPEQEVAFFTAMEVSAQAHLAEQPGLGGAARARLLAAFELGRRYAVFRTSRLHRAERPLKSQALEQAAAKIPRHLRAAPEEWLGFVPRYRSGRLGGFCLVERGVRTHVNVEPSELFARILALRPEGFYLFHNHPSGNPDPSDPDFELTLKVGEIGRKLGARLLDHGIVLPGDSEGDAPAVSWIGVL